MPQGRTDQGVVVAVDARMGGAGRRNPEGIADF
jgi:hypothetical protein